MGGGGDRIFPIYPPDEQGHIERRDLGGASGGTHATHDALNGEFNHRLEIAPFSRSHGVHDFQPHGAGLCTSITRDASHQLGIGLDDRGIVGNHGLYGINGLVRRSVGELDQVHLRLNHGLTRQAHLQLVVTLLSVHRNAGPTHATPATTPSGQPVACKLQGLQDGQAFGDLIFSPHHIDRYHGNDAIQHLYPP